ncbi:MAG: HEAT repeat domain-containing protein, partial [Planctomycetota bacterium]|nr:HEAT repeat domain-containing protein [Planctomycetota bacterium]
PDTERRAIVLRYLHDLDYAEMARALGASPLACRLRVHRALTRLRGRLGASGPAWLVALVALSRPARASALVPIGGALLMATTGKLALGAAAVLATAAVIVGVTSRSEDADRLPPRAETARTEVAAAERARKTAEAPPLLPDLGAVRQSVEEARESASGVEVEMAELHEGVGALAEGLRLIEALEGREEAALKPDPITRRYLDELVASCRRLPEGEERADILRTFGATYKRYTEATGDRTLDVFLVEALDQSAHKDERNAAAEALFGKETPAPRLLKLMESPHTEVRWRVASRLAWVRGEDRPRAIERLYPALNDKDPIVRWNAALGLGNAAPDARTFEAVLDRLAREQDQRVAYPLARTALKIDREAARSRINRMLPALPSETREIVSKALQRAE